MTECVPERLYHYCDLRALNGIVQDKCIWMTSLFWMDDTTEVFWLFDVALKVIKDLPEGERNELHERLSKSLEAERTLSHIYGTSFDAEGQQWIRVEIPKGGSCHVSVSHGKLKRTVPHNSFPDKVFA